MSIEQGNLLHICSVTSDGDLWHTIRYANGSWQPFTDIKGRSGNPGFSVDVACTGDKYNGYLLHSSCVTSDGGLWHTIRHANGSWQPFGNIKSLAGNPGSFMVVACAVVNPGQLHLGGVTSDGGLWHTIRYANGSWQPFGNVKGQTGDPGSFVDIACWCNNGGELHLCGMTNDGSICHTIRYANGSWQPIKNVMGQVGYSGSFQRISVDGLFIP